MKRQAACPDATGGPRAARSAAAIVATVVLVMSVAACSGGSPTRSGSANAGESTGSPSAVAFSACMRRNGVPRFPDPDRSEQIPKRTAQQLGVSGSQLEEASRACGHLLPGGGTRRRTQAQVQHAWDGVLAFARCMRSHGVSNFPDPTPYPPRPNEPTLEMPASLSPTPRLISKMHACQRLVPDNFVGGHIDNDSWQDVSRELAQ